MATRQPHNAPPGSDADTASNQPDGGSAAPSPEERPTDRIHPAAARPLPPGEEPTVERRVDGAPARGDWVAARPDPEADDASPPAQPTTGWGTGTGASPWSQDPSQPRPDGRPEQAAAAPVAGSGSRPGWSGSSGPGWGSGPAGPSWGAGPRQDGPSWDTAPVGSSGWGSTPEQAAHAVAPPAGRRGPLRTVLAIVAAIGLLLTGAGLNRLASQREATTTTGGGIPAAAPAAPLPAGEEPVAAVARTLGPSVVQLEVGDGLGSGVIYDKNGYILTAAHVTQGSQTLTVRLFDGTALRGRVVGADQANDIAVVKVDRSGLRPANLALKSDVQVGQMAVAIGSPFGLEQTVTQGVVSAKDRSLRTGGQVLDVIQTDTPINPGNSGGALADRQGRVIGINDSIRSESGGNEGVGFAIPIDTAAASAERIVKGQPIQTGYLGVSLNTPALGRAGALVDDVAQGSPAEQAGLEVGDLVVKIGDQPVQSSDDLAAQVRRLSPGQSAVVHVIRDGKEQTVSVKLGQRPSSPAP
ncbi:MAG TPA: trypsin-like peptidase domain-containing protein [Actinomycetes bacterium]